MSNLSNLGPAGVERTLCKGREPVQTGLAKSSFGLPPLGPFSPPLPDDLPFLGNGSSEFSSSSRVRF